MSREVMQRALEALEQIDGAMPFPVGRSAITALRAALAEPEQEPVAVWELFDDGWDSIADPEWMESLPVGTKLYTHPPQRKPLTDEELIQCFRATNTREPLEEGWPGLERFARAIEQAHGIKQEEA